MPRRIVLMPLLLAGMGLTTLLTGCQAEVEAELEIGDIRERETQGLFATSQVSSEDCDRGTRSMEREGSAGWTTWVLSGVFPDTRYRSCRQTDAGAVTTFRNMIVFDAMPDAAFSGLSHVNIKLHDRLLSVGLPSYVQDNIERVQQQVGLETKPRVTVRLGLVNNSDSSFGYRVAEYLADGSVSWGERRHLSESSRVTLEFPVEMADQVMNGARAPLLKIHP